MNPFIALGIPQAGGGVKSWGTSHLTDRLQSCGPKYLTMTLVSLHPSTFFRHITILLLFFIVIAALGFIKVMGDLEIRTHGVFWCQSSVSMRQFVWRFVAE